MKSISNFKNKYDKLDNVSKAIVNITSGFIGLYIGSKILFYLVPASARGICGFISLFVHTDLTGSWLYRVLALSIMSAFVVVGLWHFLKFVKKNMDSFDEFDIDEFLEKFNRKKEDEE